MSKSILYIEDNPDNMLLVERLLKSKGFTMLQAPNGISGVEAAQLQRPDLILLDINLPDIDGYEVARRLRASASTSAIPIIAITANAMKGDVDRALTAGCDAYIPKPINLRELWTNINLFTMAIPE